LSPGTNGFLLGTDELGRDLFVRIIYGAQISLFVGLVTTFIGTVAGVSIGLISGYFGGAVDRGARPSRRLGARVPLHRARAVAGGGVGPSLPIVIAVITFFAWAGIARVVRGQVLSIREKEYIEAARSLGAGPWRIMFIDILPNLLAPVLVLATPVDPGGDRLRGDAGLPRARRPAADGELGQHPGRRQSYYQSPGGTWCSRADRGW